MFAIVNAVYALTGHRPFSVKAMQHPRRPSTLGARTYTVALKQPENTSDTGLSASITRVRGRAGTQQGDMSVPGTINMKNNEKAKHASTKANRLGLLRSPGIDTTESHEQSGTGANTSGQSVPGMDADKEIGWAQDSAFKQ
ncbi:hypothetical protein PHMEG_0003118 [Phytophthora megakarya]|uniref:Uncharacterized protein n=1 Tax=Phytophthora megakarya TaxID=4795 RepID=A0A225WWX9_9STRA|nr:hypothetical protein PHMEG_0003118 [Phytophthora megakarya]